MANTLKIKRGTAATIPQGQIAEPLFTTDTYDLYIGKGAGGNQRIQNYIASGTSSQFLKGDGTLDSTSYQPLITAGTTLQYYRGDKTFQTLDTSVVPENGPIYFTEPRVRATVLTGLNLSGGGTIAATDSILTAFGKVQNQISALVGGATYQGTWNASTNTPTLASGTGTKGYYYVVSVAGSTNLDGITDWKIGDWAIFNGTTWDKVDNTDAVSSVNGFTGAVNLALDNISDVSAASPTNAQLLRFNGTSSLWENWTPTFEPALTKGNLTEATSSVLTITGGTGAVIGSGTTIQVASAGAAQNGVVTTGTQTFAGAKTFNSTVTASALYVNGMTAGSGAIYHTGSRLTFANYNASGTLNFEVNGGASAMTINADKTIQMDYYTTNGFVKFSSSNGTLSVDTTSYLPLTGGTITGNLVVNGNIALIATTGFPTVGFLHRATDNILYAKMPSGGFAFSDSLNNINLSISSSGALSGTSATFSGIVEVGNTVGSAINSASGLGNLVVGNGGASSQGITIYTGASTYGGLNFADATTGGGAYAGYIKFDHSDNSMGFFIGNVSRLSIASTGAATFSSSVTAAGGLISNGGSIGYGGGELGFNVTTSGATSGIYTTATGSPILYFDHRATGNTGFWVWRSGTGGGTTALTLSNAGAATFSSSVTAATETNITGTSVNSRLLVTAAGVANTVLGFNNSGATTTGVTNNTSYVGVLQGYPLVFITDSTERLRIASTGAATFSSSVTAANLILNVDGAATWTQYLKTTQTGAKRNSIGFFDNGGTNIASILTDNANNNTADFAIHVPNGSPRLYINSSGNVGIGTTSPATDFQVVRSGSVTGRFTNTATSVNTEIGVTGGLGYVGTQSANAFGIITSDTERMRITSGGNVGIGTTSPGYKLDVQGAAGTIARITDGTSHMTFYAGSSLNEIATVSPLLLTVNGSERMRITSGGNTQFKGAIQTYTIGSTTTLGPTYKWGNRVAGTCSVSTTAYLEVEVGGTIYYLAFANPS